MKIGIAMMSHETNTFSPVITDIERFSGGRNTPLQGQTAIDVFADTASCLGGYIEVATQRGAEIEMGIAAGAPPIPVHSHQRSTIALMLHIACACRQHTHIFNKYM